MTDEIVTMLDQVVPVHVPEWGHPRVELRVPGGWLAFDRKNAMRLAEAIFDAVQASDTSAAVTACRGKKMEIDDV